MSPEQSYSLAFMKPEHPSSSKLEMSADSAGPWAQAGHHSCAGGGSSQADCWHTVVYHTLPVITISGNSGFCCETIQILNAEVEFQCKTTNNNKIFATYRLVTSSPNLQKCLSQSPPAGKDKRNQEETA